MKKNGFLILIYVFLLNVILTANDKAIPVEEQFRDTSGNLLHACCTLQTGH